MNPYHHALSSVKLFGGVPADYLPIHQWFDESKAFYPDFRHRALRHHAEGIFLAEKIFGVAITNTDGRVLPTRFIGEQHVKEDLGRIPTVQDWLECVAPKPWMLKSGRTSDASSQPAADNRCECENDGYFYSGVPGIIARMQRGRLAPGAKVERCDLCRRYCCDEAARRKLVERGLADR